MSKRYAHIFVQGQAAGLLMEEDGHYILQYHLQYHGPPISLTLPVQVEPYRFNAFPAFFDGLLPEGPQLEALLKRAKLDRYDYLGQLIQVGHDLVGAVTVQEANHD